jgi:hypothetical protein
MKLSFYRHISNFNYTATLIDVSNILLGKNYGLFKNLKKNLISSSLLFFCTDLYMNEVGKYSTIDDLFVRLQYTVEMEMQYQKDLLQVVGTLETIFVAQNTIV